MGLIRASVFEGGAPGPRLVVLGAVHRNETCGTRAAATATCVDREHAGDAFARPWKSVDAVRRGERAEWFYCAQRHPRLAR
jgi:hypothetical protein